MLMALMETLTGTLIGGGIALFGSWMNNRNNVKNAEALRQHDRWKANRDLYLKKGEDLYTLFDAWSFHSITNLNLCACTLVDVVPAEVTKKQANEAREKVNIHLLQTLVEVYFSKLQSDFYLMHKEWFRLDSIYKNHIRHGKTEDAQTAFENIIEGTESLSEKTVKFKKKYVKN